MLLTSRPSCAFCVNTVRLGARSCPVVDQLPFLINQWPGGRRGSNTTLAPPTVLIIPPQKLSDNTVDADNVLVVGGRDVHPAFRVQLDPFRGQLLELELRGPADPHKR